MGKKRQSGVLDIGVGVGDGRMLGGGRLPTDIRLTFNVQSATERIRAKEGGGGVKLDGAESYATRGLPGRRRERVENIGKPGLRSPAKKED